MKTYNLILDVDSYKDEHGRMLKDNVEYLQSSIIPRKCNADVYTSKVVPFGYIYYIKEYLLQPITQEHIDEAEMYFNMHGASVDFNRKRWEYIIEKHNGYLPLKINAVKEGTIMPLSVPLVRVENTDPECAWLVSYVETALLRATWYGTTVATNALTIKKHLQDVMDKHTGTPHNVDFHLHNFGARGNTSHESEIISSMAHLTVFKGTDGMLANKAINHYYGDKRKPVPYGFSVIASEHSVSCSQADYESRNDFAIAEKMLNILESELDKKEKAGIQTPTIVSIVIDTYDAYRFANDFIGTKLKNKVIELGKRGGKIVLRPDSGDPTKMPIEIIKILMNRFGYNTNVKGYKVLPEYLGVLQGDGVNAKSITQITDNLEAEKIALTNLIFGMGGQLVVPSKGRDTYSFAMKATAQKLKDSNEWQHLIKDPITDIGKRSLSGYISTFKDKEKQHVIVAEIERMNKSKDNYWQDLLLPVFENGRLFSENISDFSEIRNNILNA